MFVRAINEFKSSQKATIIFFKEDSKFIAEIISVVLFTHIHIYYINNKCCVRGKRRFLGYCSMADKDEVN